MLSTLAEMAPLFSDNGLMGLGAGLGAGLVCMGSGKAIGHLAGNAVDAMARQPEIRGNAFIAMIIAAALIEGFTFFALVVCNAVAGKIVAAAAGA
jgi:F-type H+-transporting ATPase subunit c